MCCGSITHRKKVRTQDVKTSHAQILPAVFVPQHRYSDSEPFVVDRIRGTRNVVSNAGSDSQTSSGSNERPAGPRSHRVCSRLEIEIAHTIATFRTINETCSEKLWVFWKIFQQLKPC